MDFHWFFHAFRPVCVCGSFLLILVAVLWLISTVFHVRNVCERGENVRSFVCVCVLWYMVDCIRWPFPYTFFFCRVTRQVLSFHPVASFKIINWLRRLNARGLTRIKLKWMRWYLMHVFVDGCVVVDNVLEMHLCKCTIDAMPTQRTSMINCYWKSISNCIPNGIAQAPLCVCECDVRFSIATQFLLFSIKTISQPRKKSQNACEQNGKERDENEIS